MQRGAIEAAVRRHLAKELERGDLDILGEDAGILDLSADNWTIHLEGLPTAPWGFLALDDEPADPSDHAGAIAKTFSGGCLTALAAVDRELGGALSAALARSGDPLSVAMAAALAAEPG